MERMNIMIFHVNRLSFKADVSPDEKSRGLDLLRQQGESIPAVKSFVVGPELGGDFEYGAIFVIEDLDGYWEYLTHPAHFESEKSGLHLIERFEAFDTTDSDDPEYGDKIAALHSRSYQENPELAKLVSEVPSFVVPDGSESTHWPQSIHDGPSEAL
jgi:hypothetical protein